MERIGRCFNFSISKKMTKATKAQGKSQPYHNAIHINKIISASGDIHQSPVLLVFTSPTRGFDFKNFI
jgi:hypothetical protein